MKRIILCILTVIICLTGTGALADQHLEVQGTFPGLTGGIIVSFDVYEQEGKETAVSSLFPDLALEIGEPGQKAKLADLFCAVRPDMLIRIEKKTDELIAGWTAGLNAETRQGSFAGDLFETASSMTECEFRLSDFADFLRRETEEETAPGTGQEGETVSRIIHTAAGRIIEAAGADADIYLKSFDNGQYFTAEVCREGATVMTFSWDRTDAGDRKMITGWKTEGRYCYRYTEYCPGEDTFAVTSNFRTSSSSAWQNAMLSRPLFSQKTEISARADGTLSVQSTFSADCLSNPLIMSGEIVSDRYGSGQFTGVVYIQGHSDEMKSYVTVFLEDLYSTVSFTDKKVTDIRNEKESDDAALSMTQGLTQFASDIMLSLPSEYQSILLSFILQ